jgi:hypothetical protein
MLAVLVGLRRIEMVEARIRALSVVVACGIGAAVTVACKEPPREIAVEDVESELVGTWCEAMFDCNCPEGRVYFELADCARAAEMIAAGLEMYAGAMGMEYDPTCVGEFVDRIEDRGCAAPGAFDDDCESPCNPLFGTRDVGQSCESVGDGLSDCKQGLVCYGTCEDPCGIVGAKLGERCEEVGCGEGLFCKWNADFTEARCAEPPPVGQPCPDGVCNGDAFCALPDPMALANICIAPREAGEPCMGHLQCESGYCPAGYCDQVPGRGDPCPAQVCDTGSTCREGVCEAAAAEVCWLDLPWYWYGPIDG